MSNDRKDGNPSDGRIDLTSDAATSSGAEEGIAPQAEDRLDEQLSALLDGELDPASAADLELSIAADPALAQRLDAFRALDRSLAELAQPEPSSDLLARTRARIAAEEPAASEPANVTPLHRTTSGSWLGRGAPYALAALAAGLVLALYLAPRTGTEPEVAGLEDWERFESELGGASEEEIAIAIEIETLSDLEVIRELDLLEALAEASEREGAGSG